MSSSNSSITSNIPSGTTYHFNPYARQGNLPWTVVNNNMIMPSLVLAPAPKVSSPPSPIASDDDGLSQGGDISMEGENGSVSSYPTTPNSTCLPQPLQHIVPTPACQVAHQQIANLNGRIQFVQPVPQSKLHRLTPATHGNNSNNQQHRLLPTSNGAMVAGNVHTALAHYPVRYMSYADLRAQHHVSNQNLNGIPSVKLFVGQVLHELRPAELSTMFALLANTSAAKVVPHGPGCFFVELPANQFRGARQLNGRVLFDVHGLWFAEGPEEAKAMQEYVASVKQGLKTMRLPRSTLVVRR